MRLNIIPIGNSQRIRLPKALLKQYRFNKVVEIETADHYLILKPIIKPVRENWLKAFKEMAYNKEDTLLDFSYISDSWDKEEWEW